MKMQTRGSSWARWLGGLALLAAAGPALALNNWELGKSQFVTECFACHNLPGGVDGTKQPFPAGHSATTVQGKINTGMRGLVTDPLATANAAVINDTISNIAAYLSRTTFPLATLSPLNVAFADVSVDLARTQTFRLSNNGTAALAVSGIAVSDITNYSVPAASCPSVAAGSFCDFDVTFAPKSVNSFDGRTLTVSHNTFAASSTATLGGTGLVQFSVAPTSLNFTPLTAPAGVLQATVTDNKGDRIRICRADALTFNFPGDFTLDAPFTLGGDGCVTTATSGALPRSLALNVRFAAGAVGPRNGALTIRRVDAGGATLGGTTTIQLQGNPGPLATVNRSSLFDAPADPGVEVDNDNVLERTVTLFSQGSQPLPFNGSSFTLSGASSGEYTLAGTGCQALASLPASIGGTPPSCELTVRFNPSDVGRRGPATLNIQIAGANSNSVLLNGLGIRGPRLAVRRGGVSLGSGDVVQFGTQSIGGVYAPVALTLGNGGTAGDLEVQLPAAGSVPGFTFVAGAGCATLAAAASCSVDVRFDPAAAQAYASTFAIRTRPAGSGAAFAVLSLDLRGQGAAGAVPVLSWTDTTGTPITRLDFADTQLGTPRTSRVRLYNDGPGGVVLQFANVVGLGASNFVLDTADCAAGKAVFEKTSCEIGVQFAPAAPGAKAASVQFATGAGAVPVVAPLLAASGTAIGSATPAALALSSMSVAFADTVVGSATTPVELKLSNTGSRSLAVTDLQIAAPFAMETKTCAGVPFVLAPGTECTLSVSFRPSGEGAAVGILRVTSDADPAIRDVALSGSGEAAADVSGGGCSIGSGTSLLDPTLWLLALLAVGTLAQRRRRGGGATRRGGPAK